MEIVITISLMSIIGLMIAIAKLIYDNINLEEKLRIKVRDNDEGWENFYSHLVELGYGEFTYHHINKPNKAYCHIKREFSLFNPETAINKILEKRKK